MKTALYSNIRPAFGQTKVDVIRRAHALGYELLKFVGFDDADLGYAGNRGPLWMTAKANGAILREIQDACVVNTANGKDWPHIIQIRKAVASNKNKGRSISKNPSHLNWYLGLTKDFRNWKILTTTENPNDVFDNKYVWFYGPFKSKEDAEEYKRKEGLKNPRRK